MKVKKQRVNLTNHENNDILDKLEGGAKQKDIVEQYKIGQSTILGILKCKSDIRHKFAIAGSSKSRKFTVSPLDDALITWISFMRQRGHPISAAELKAKALSLNEKLGGKEDCGKYYRQPNPLQIS